MIHTVTTTPLFFSMWIFGTALLFGCATAPMSKDTDWNETDSAAGKTDTSSDTAGIDEQICGDIETTAVLSAQIPTVGIVTWTTSLKIISSAHIEFGRENIVEYRAPVHLDVPEYRTLLLGMKPSSTYYFQVVAVGDGMTCRSQPGIIETGPLATHLPVPQIVTSDPESVSGEFIVTSQLTRPTVFILDKDGEVVWWYNFGNADYEGEELLGFSRAHISADGTEMWGGNINFSRGNGRLYRVSMDGLNEAEPEITYHHHDFTVLPDNRLALLQFDEDTTGSGQGTCDSIVERAPDGSIEVVYPLREGLAYLADQTEWCHANAIHYLPTEDAYYVSLLMQNMIVKVDRAARQLEWILDGDDPLESDFSGVTWQVQHGFHPLENDTLLVFNNGGEAGGLPSPAHALAFRLDETQGTATEEWQYETDINCPMLGDVQRLSNGNTLVTFSTAGAFHEVDDDSLLVRQITFAGGEVVGYADARRSLYGPPDRY